MRVSINNVPTSECNKYLPTYQPTTNIQRPLLISMFILLTMLNDGQR